MSVNVADILAVVAGPAMAVPVTATSASRVLLTGSGTLRGWNFAETTGTTAAIVELFDGRDDTGTLLCAIRLAGGASNTESLGIAAVVFRVGIYMQIPSGSVEGAVYLAPGPV